MLRRRAMSSERARAIASVSTSDEKRVERPIARERRRIDGIMTPKWPRWSILTRLATSGSPHRMLNNEAKRALVGQSAYAAVCVPPATRRHHPFPLLSRLRFCVGS